MTQEAAQIHDEAVEFGYRLIEHLILNDSDAMDKSIKLASQKLARYKREYAGGTKDVILEIGKFDGLVDTYREIYTNIMKQDLIQLAKNELGETFDRIVLALSSEKADRIGVYHVDLAAQLDMKYEQLTEIMKTMLFYRVVSACGIGKTTRYSLEKSTKLYMQRHNIKSRVE